MCKEIKKKYKTNGGFKQAVSDIKKILAINPKSFKSWNGVCELLKKYNNNNNFFKSKQAEYLFYLTKLEGKQRNNLLGLEDSHYEDKEIAKKWYREIANLVHPDKGGNNEAFNTLNKIYQILIEDED
jgi:hypothetical protein